MGKHVPERMCVGCRESYPKPDMIRIVRSPEGAFDLDDTGKKQGRGAYICRKLSCLREAKKKRALDRSFKANVTDEIYDKLAGMLTAVEAPNHE